jgi:hypothetical protein
LNVGPDPQLCVHGSFKEAAGNVVDPKLLIAVTSDQVCLNPTSEATQKYGMPQ